MPSSVPPSIPSSVPSSAPLASQNAYSRSVSAILRDFAAVCGTQRAVYAAFGGTGPFHLHARALDRFAPLSRLPVGRRAGLSPQEIRVRFVDECVRGWTARRRPGLPQLARALLRDVNVDLDDRAGLAVLPAPERALVRAVMLVAARAEMNKSGAANAYHNPVHTAHVATMAGYLANLNDQLGAGTGVFLSSACVTS